MWNKVVSKGQMSAFALLISLSGCTAISDCKYEISQKIRTHQAWGEFDGCQSRCFTFDYSSGWKAGFYDVATGGTGCPPVFAPSKYWKPPVFCTYDPSRRDEWYTGFQDGAAYAKCQPDHHYLHPYLPPQNCCPVQTASCPEVVEEAIDFPMDHIGGDDEYLAPPMDGSHLDNPSAGFTAPDSKSAAPESEPASRGTETEDKVMDKPVDPPSSAETYEKDPEPGTSETTPSVNSTLQQRLVQQHREQLRKQANVSQESLLKRLVLNSALPSSAEGP